MLALDRKLFRDLRHRWGQILAIALIVACGIASFVAMQSTYESLQLSQAGRYAVDARQYLIDAQFRTIQRDDVTIVFNEPRPARTRYDVAHLPGVLYAEPFRTVAARLRFEHRTRKVAIMGLSTTGELRHLVDRHLNAVNLPLDGVLLSTKLAEILGIQPGQSLTVEVLEGARPIRTVPVAGLVDELIGLTAYMDIQALNRLMREGSSISGAFLAVDQRQLDPLYTLLKRTPAITSVALRQAMIERFQQTVAQTQTIANLLQVGFACIIAFGVVYNAARIALSERNRELATLRIIGFTKAEIAVILLGEQAIITLVAIPLGLLLGYGISALLSLTSSTELYRFPLIVSKYSYAFTVVVIAIAAAVSGFLVRRQCNQLDLIAVLKTRECSDAEFSVRQPLQCGFWFRPDAAWQDRMSPSLRGTGIVKRRCCESRRHSPDSFSVSVLSISSQSFLKV